MKKLRFIPVFLLLSCLAFAQNPDSNKIVVTDLGDQITIKLGDSVVSFSYESMAEYYLDNGIEKGAEGDFEGALQDFNLALLYIDYDAEIYYNRGLAYYYLEDFTASILDFSVVIQLDSTHYEALNQRGIAYSQKDSYTLALLDFDQAIRQNPDLSNAYLNKGITYLLMGEMDNACELLGIAKEKGHEKADGIMEQYCY